MPTKRIIMQFNNEQTRKIVPQKGTRIGFQLIRHSNRYIQCYNCQGLGRTATKAQVNKNARTVCNGNHVSCSTECPHVKQAKLEGHSRTKERRQHIINDTPTTPVSSTTTIP
eukprot:Pgem_evm1s19788